MKEKKVFFLFRSFSIIIKKLKDFLINYYNLLNFSYKKNYLNIRNFIIFFIRKYKKLSK